MEKPPVVGSEQKIKEYVERIRSGESKDSILQGLPPSFVAGIEASLSESENTLSLETKSETLEQTGPQENNIIDYTSLKSEDILKKLAEYSEPYMSAPIEAVGDGTFAGWAKLKIANGEVILTRHATDENHLIKSGKTASPDDMMNSSLFSGGASKAGAVHTSADVDNWANKYDSYPVYGEFRIPVKDFLQLGSEGKIIIGNLGEAEIVISGDVAKKYLTQIINK